ncbi:putative sigma-54 modulation protein [Paenibacillus mucilaginosus]|uniref:ribosome hibernation-promoting factor, HPF/YfiA family n=1 Tax=Paenibacillus mucilaginosus TaxID=61624 RepID=UPI003D212B7E
MRLNIHGKHFEVTPALEAYAQDKIGRLEGWLHPGTDVQINLSVQGHRHLHVVEVTIHEEGTVFRAEEKQEDMYASIDLAADKLERMIRKWRERLRRRSRRGDGRTGGAEPALPTAYEDAEELGVVRSKRIQLKPVELEEALLEMQLLGHDFHLFFNRETGVTELVYKRHDGTFGHLTTA